MTKITALIDELENALQKHTQENNQMKLSTNLVTNKELDENHLILVTPKQLYPIENYSYNDFNNNLMLVTKTFYEANTNTLAKVCLITIIYKKDDEGELHVGFLEQDGQYTYMATKETSTIFYQGGNSTIEEVLEYLADINLEQSLKQEDVSNVEKGFSLLQPIPVHTFGVDSLVIGGHYENSVALTRVDRIVGGYNDDHIQWVNLSDIANHRLTRVRNLDALALSHMVEIILPIVDKFIDGVNIVSDESLTGDVIVDCIADVVGKANLESEARDVELPTLETEPDVEPDDWY